jgi:hypothetical protein
MPIKPSSSYMLSPDESNKLEKFTTQLAEELQFRGKAPNHNELSDWTPEKELRTHITLGLLDKVDALINNHPEIDLLYSVNGLDALQLAAAHGHAQIVEKLEAHKNKAQAQKQHKPRPIK